MPYAHNGTADLYYETFGDIADPALLMINGLGSQCINYHPEMCERFVARGFFVIRFDNRDVGLSTKFDQVNPNMGAVVEALRKGREPNVAYTLPDMATDALAVLDDLVMSTTGDPDVGQASAEALAFVIRPPATDRASAIARYQEGIRTYGSPAHYDADRLAQMAGEAYDRCFNPAGVARQMMAVMTSGSRSDRLREVRVSSLIMHGDADKLVDISGGRRTAECISEARFEVLEGMGHDYPPAFWNRWAELVADHAGVTAKA